MVQCKGNITIKNLKFHNTLENAVNNEFKV